jgi:hypothetical protein
MIVDLILRGGSEMRGLIDVGAMEWGKHWTNSSGSNAFEKICCSSGM